MHLWRDLTFLAEAPGLWWVAQLKALLLDMTAATEQARMVGAIWPDPLAVADGEAGWLERLDEGDRLHPPTTAPPGIGGRCQHSAARHLLDRLRQHQQAALRFLDDLRMDCATTQAERDRRIVKVQQKVSGCFRAFAGA